jgi:tetratricopeptide (TPR) repeat protein
MDAMMNLNQGDVEKLVDRGFRILERKEEPAEADWHEFSMVNYFVASEAAQILFRQAIERDASNYRAWLGLGMCLSYTPKLYGEALDAYLKAKALGPANSEIDYELGLLFLRAGNHKIPLCDLNVYDEALRYFLSARDAGYGPQARICDCIGTTYSRMGDYAEAARWFEEAAEHLEREGGWIPSIFYLGAQAYEALHQYKDALRWYQLIKVKGLGSDEETAKWLDEKIRYYKTILKNVGAT